MPVPIPSDEISRLYAELERLREAQSELQDYKLQLESILDNSPVEVLLKDKQGRYVLVSKQFERTLGFTNEEVSGLTPDQVIDDEVAVQARAHDLSVLQSGRPLVMEETLFSLAEQEPRNLLTVRFPIIDSNGEVQGLGSISTDITDKVRAVDRFTDIVDAVRGIVWEVDSETDKITFISAAVLSLCGYEPDDIYRNQWSWKKLVHPDDLAWYQQEMLHHRESSSRYFELEYRVLHADQRVVWVRDQVSVKFDGDIPQWRRGITTDITRERAAEYEVQQAEVLFEQIFRSASIGMLIADMEKEVILEVNPAFCQIVGRSADQLNSLGLFAITHPEDLVEEIPLFEKLKHHRQSDSRYQIEKRYFKPDGSVIWAAVEATLLHQRQEQSPQLLLMATDITERKQSEEKIWQQANFDFLTGLPNRKMLLDRLSHLMLQADRHEKQLAVVMIDLDEFKDVNDTLGHDVGDLLLIEAAARIQSCLRRSDTTARLGGDEFIVVLDDVQDPNQVEGIVGKILEQFSLAFEMQGSQVFVSASIGITLYPTDGEDLVSLLKNADQAMYESKRLGKNCYSYFEKHLQVNALKRVEMVSRIRQACQNREFILYFQPIIDLASLTIDKAEALIRWPQADGSMISPKEFIPVAESSGLIKQIGGDVLDMALSQTRQWRESLNPDFQVSVNISPIQFEEELKIQEYLQEWGLPGNALNLEITEQLMMKTTDRESAKLLQLRDLNVQVALDDFGTGYSSLAYLQKLDIDYLKIDRSFVMNLKSDSDEYALCEAVIKMANSLGLKVIAEGIESREQASLLLDLGCHYGQGYYFTRPLPAKQFYQYSREFLRR